MTRAPLGPKHWLGSKAKRISKGCKNSLRAFTPFQSKADSAGTPTWARSRNPPALLLDEHIGTVDRSRSPSPVLRTPSPPVGERDGVRGSGSWRALFRFFRMHWDLEPSFSPFQAGSGTGSP